MCISCDTNELLAQFQSLEVNEDHAFLRVATINGTRYALGFIGSYASSEDAEGVRDALQRAFPDDELVLVKRTSTRRYDVKRAD